MVRQWQTAFYGKRYSQTDPHRKTDFVKLAEGFGPEGLPLHQSCRSFRKPLPMPCSRKGPTWIRVHHRQGRKGAAHDPRRRRHQRHHHGIRRNSTMESETQSHQPAGGQPERRSGPGVQPVLPPRLQHRQPYGVRHQRPHRQPHHGRPLPATKRRCSQLILQTERLEVTRQVFVLDHEKCAGAGAAAAQGGIAATTAPSCGRSPASTRPKIIDLSPDSMVFELIGKPERLDAFLKMFAGLHHPRAVPHRRYRAGARRDAPAYPEAPAGGALPSNCPRRAQ